MPVRLAVGLLGLWLTAAPAGAQSPFPVTGHTVQDFQPLATAPPEPLKRALVAPHPGLPECSVTGGVALPPGATPCSAPPPPVGTVLDGPPLK